MIVVTGFMRLPAEQIEAARAPMRAVLEATRAEPGCIEYAFAEDVLEPGLIRIQERWRDWAALEAHGKSAHMATWRQAVPSLKPLGREVVAYEVAETRPL